MNKKIMMIKVDSNENNNKFYEIELSGDVVYKRYGRVGEKGQELTSSGGEKEFNKVYKTRLKRGYKEADIDLNVEEETLNSKGNIMEIAMEQIKTDDFSKKLIKRLVESNIHNITSNTKITFDIKTGYFKTPLGIVTKQGVDKAIKLLHQISSVLEKTKTITKRNTKFISLNQDYFTKIPTKIKNLREIDNLLITEDKVKEQLHICEALIESIEIIAEEKEKIKSKEDGGKIKHEKVFDTSVFLLEDKKEFKRVNKYFEDSKNRQHGRANNNSKIKNIYKISLGKEEEEFRSKLDNQMELFHGTRVANLLSILKGGLLMPKYSPGSVTGYMYGQGLYFASQSTKSLNYCDGGHWNGSSKSNTIYMFIADIAMGNYEIPVSWHSKNPKKGFDSFWAKGGQSGVINDEMIIFNNNQIKLKYILEISL